MMNKKMKENCCYTYIILIGLLSFGRFGISMAIFGYFSNSQVAMRLIHGNPAIINTQDVPFEYEHNINNTVLKWVQDHSVGRVKRHTDEGELSTTGISMFSNVTAPAYVLRNNKLQDHEQAN